VPRRSRIDALGAVHHIMARGIERRIIFENNADRENFINRLGCILKETGTACYAWALMPNHFHLLLRTGHTPITTVMRRLLTGYAIWFNIRRHRVGHLFQNRYKSVLCQEDTYFLELVRYIHLNPIRAGLVDNMVELDYYNYSGHSSIMGTMKDSTWLKSEDVLILFGKRRNSARRAYRTFVERGITQGRRPELTGGGLIRSAGGWERIKYLRREGVYQRSDERILGDGNFVDQALEQSKEAMDKRYALRAGGMDLGKIGQRVAELMKVEVAEVWAKGKYPRIVDARSLFCFWAVRELGIDMASLGRELGLSISAISKSVKRGQHISESQGFRLLEN